MFGLWEFRVLRFSGDSFLQFGAALSLHGLEGFPDPRF